MVIPPAVAITVTPPVPPVLMLAFWTTAAPCRPTGPVPLVIGPATVSVPPVVRFTGPAPAAVAVKVAPSVSLMKTPPEPAAAVTEPAAVWTGAPAVPMELAPAAGVVSVTGPVPALSSPPAGWMMDPPVELPPVLVITVIPPPEPAAMSPTVAPPVPPPAAFTLTRTAAAVAFVVVMLPPAFWVKPWAPARPGPPDFGPQRHGVATGQGDSTTPSRGWPHHRECPGRARQRDRARPGCGGREAGPIRLRHAHPARARRRGAYPRCRQDRSAWCANAAGTRGRGRQIHRTRAHIEQRRGRLGDGPARRVAPRVGRHRDRPARARRDAPQCGPTRAPGRRVHVDPHGAPRGIRRRDRPARVHREALRPDPVRVGVDRDGTAPGPTDVGAQGHRVPARQRDRPAPRRGRPRHRQGPRRARQTDGPGSRPTGG